MDRDVDLVDVEKFHQETSDVKCFRCSSVDGIQFGRSAEDGECNFCMRSASTVDCCSHSVTTNPVVDFLIFGHPAQSLSTKTLLLLEVSLSVV